MAKKRWGRVLSGVLALVMLIGMGSGLISGKVSAATSSSEIKKQLDELKAQKSEITARIKDLEGKLSDNLNKMEEIVAQKDIIDQEVFLLHEQIININEQISAYNVLLADKQVELEAAEAHLADLNAKYKERIRAMEEGGALSYWSVLFKANSFSDLLDRMSMIEEIATADRRRLEELRIAAAVVEDAKAELQIEKLALEDTKTELDETQASLGEKREEADQLLMELQAIGEEFEMMIEDSEELQAQLALEIAEREKDYKNAQYQEWLATSVPPTTKPPAPTTAPNPGSVGGSGTAGTENTVGGVTWLVPVNYNRFSSPFGLRLHPIYGDYRMHYGVDLSAPSGTPIIASRSGVVTIAAYQAGGAGNYVTINHQDGYSTVYMHMTHYIVSVGQYVGAGEVIGYVGSTGASTGAHLHFGVMYNGSYVNPADYIAI